MSVVQMLYTLSDSAAGWSPMNGEESQTQILQNVFLCLSESNTVPSMVKRVQCGPHQGMVSCHGSCNKGFNRFHKELENKDGPSGLSFFKIRGLDLYTCSPTNQLLDAGCSQKGTRLWERWLPSADRNSQRAIQLRAFSPQPSQQRGAEGRSGRTASTEAPSFSMSRTMLAIVFLPGEMDWPWIVFTQDS